MQAWVEEWAHAAAHVHVLSGPYDPRMNDTYLRWFHEVTRVRCFPMLPEVTDTFATDIAVSYHAMVCEVVSFVLTFILIIKCGRLGIAGAHVQGR